VTAPQVHRASRAEAGGRIRILWLTKGLGRGGAERLLVSMAARFDQERFDVEVAYLLPWKDAFVADLEANGNVVHCLGARRDLDVRWPIALRRLIDARGYDVVHTHAPLVASAARMLVPRRGPALVHTEHNVWDRYRGPTYWANALTIGRNRHVFAVSHGVAESMRNRRFARLPEVEVLIHGIDFTRALHGSDAREWARAALSLPADVPVIGTVGNLTPKKDHGSLLRAVQHVRRGVPDVRLVLIGEGPLAADLRQQAKRLGIAESVLFAGSRADVDELLPALDVFAMSSLHEGLSIALVEALAAGVPAVATRVGGIPEVVTHEHDGLLVPPGAPHALGDALLELLVDRDRRLALAAEARSTAARFDIGRAVARTEALYRELLRTAPRRRG
jgi:glycosyltransferase involved in cell wall biosynthesis